MKQLDASSTRPPFSVLPTTKPVRWIIYDLEWLDDDPPVPVLLGTLPNADGSSELLLLGARYELSRALFNGTPSGHSGHFVEYFVAEEKVPESWKVHRLLQAGSVTYSDSDQNGDYVPARAVKDAAARSIGAVPRWKASEAQWPTFEGEPMTFHGQLSLPSSATARTLFTYGVNVYLFSAGQDETRLFKIVDQQSKFQTAEEHYAEEERRAKRLARKRREER